MKHPIYKDKKSLFNTPAFNFDEVETLPKGTTLLSSNPVNSVQGLQFEIGVSKVFGPGTNIPEAAIEIMDIL